MTTKTTTKRKTTIKGQTTRTTKINSARAKTKMKKKQQADEEETEADSEKPR